MTESDLTHRLMEYAEVLLPGACIFKHSDRFNAHRPDLTVTWNRRTTWWEVKFYNEEPFKSPTGQEQCCKDLAVQGLCHYIIYELRKGVRRTLIVEPHALDSWETEHVYSAPGFNHARVAYVMRTMHKVNV